MAEEIYPDEIFCSNEKPASEKTRLEKVMEALEEALQSEEFIDSQDQFIDDNCSIFTEQGDLPPHCMKVYQNYIDLIETKLLSQVQKAIPDFNFDELLPVIQQHKGSEDFVHADVFEMLEAVLDFQQFRDLMASYNRGKDIDLVVTTTKLGL